MNVQVAENTYAVMQDLTQFLNTVKVCVEDGWQPGADLPAIMISAMTNLVPMLAKISGISGEISSDKPSFERAIACGVVDMVNYLTAKVVK